MNMLIPKLGRKIVTDIIFRMLLDQFLSEHGQIVFPAILAEILGMSPIKQSKPGSVFNKVCRRQKT